ncbi:MAG: ribonuclease HII [Pseudomonadota bacterium]|nr:ribonuclease HII [Pseudomonadota bacterium]
MMQLDWLSEVAHPHGVLAISEPDPARIQAVPAEQWIAGVDEAGRGPLVGSVVTAAVILDPNQPIQGLNDSKKLSAKQREALFVQIQQSALAWTIAEATHTEIDQYNILQATMLAMRRAVLALPMSAQQVLIDGNRCPDLPMPCQAIVGGDRLEQAISAASILAKVTRDRQLQQLDQQYPQYGFAQHKGYPTAAHLAALAAHGVLDEHRRSYAPIKRLLLGQA